MTPFCRLWPRLITATALLAGTPPTAYHSATPAKRRSPPACPPVSRSTPYAPPRLTCWGFPTGLSHTGLDRRKLWRTMGRSLNRVRGGIRDRYHRPGGQPHGGDCQDVERGPEDSGRLGGVPVRRDGRRGVEREGAGTKGLARCSTRWRGRTRSGSWDWHRRTGERMSLFEGGSLKRA